MANLKSFKEVLLIAIENDSVKVIEVLDQELTMHGKQNIVNKVVDLIANKINRSQMELNLFGEPSEILDYERYCAQV